MSVFQTLALMFDRDSLEPPLMPRWRNRGFQGILDHGHTAIPKPAFKCSGTSVSFAGTCMQQFRTCQEVIWIPLHPTIGHC